MKQNRVEQSGEKKRQSGQIGTKKNRVAEQNGVETERSKVEQSRMEWSRAEQNRTE